MTSKKKLNLAEEEKAKYTQMLKDLSKESDKSKVEKDEAYLRIKLPHSEKTAAISEKTAAIAEKTAAVAEKAEIRNEKNLIVETKLVKREKALRLNISKLEFQANNLQRDIKGYKRDFIESFVGANPTVQKDINFFVQDGKKAAMEE